MTTAALTLTEFLLARIAEDEAVARSITLDPGGVAKQQFGKPGAAQWLALAIDRPWRDGIGRVLAECEAKRRIVKLLGHIAGQQPADDWNPSDTALVGVLGILVDVYSDHPDYREEWKP